MEKQVPPHGHGSGRLTKPDESDEDPVERMLKAAGCLEKHYKVQECIAETKDWRKCQGVVEDFRLCIEKSKQAGKQPN